MARFLFATVPAAGHVSPALPVAHELVKRGHAVRWYTGAAYADRVAATGAAFHSISDPSYDFSRPEIQRIYRDRRPSSGLRKLQFDMVDGFARPVLTQVRDIMALLAAEPADVIVGDAAFIGAPLVQELDGPPYAAFGITVFSLPSPHLAPFGTGLAPAKGRLGRLRNRALYRVVRSVVFRPVTVEVNAARRAFGLPPTSDVIFDFPLASRLYLQFSPPSFEYPVPDLPSGVHFVGPPRPLANPAWRPPPWWRELTCGRRVVLVNQGTVAIEPDELTRPSLTALADEDVLVVVVTGGADPDILGPLPANVRVAPFIPFDRLMPHVDVMVTNGGYGGVQLALAHGVPIVGAGKSEGDKIEVNARVARSGVGLDLRTQTPRPHQIRQAVRRLLTDPTFAARARQMRYEIEQAGREERAASLLESLARTGMASVRSTWSLRSRITNEISAPRPARTIRRPA